MNYRLAYAIGFHPWEDAAADPPFVAKATQMFDREEQADRPHGNGQIFWFMRKKFWASYFALSC